MCVGGRGGLLGKQEEPGSAIAGGESLAEEGRAGVATRGAWGCRPGFGYVGGRQGCLLGCV